MYPTLKLGSTKLLMPIMENATPNMLLAIQCLEHMQIAVGINASNKQIASYQFNTISNSFTNKGNLRVNFFFKTISFSNLDEKKAEKGISNTEATQNTPMNMKWAVKIKLRISFGTNLYKTYIPPSTRLPQIGN